MPQICDMGQMALLPLRRKACCEFFRPRNPTASARFEPAIFGTRGQQVVVVDDDDDNNKNNYLK
jgi:hypothetical protein